MKIAVTKDFVIGVLFGMTGMAWMTNKKFGDILRAEREARHNEEETESESSDFANDDNVFFGM